MCVKVTVWSRKKTTSIYYTGKYEPVQFFRNFSGDSYVFNAVKLFLCKKSPHVPVFQIHTGILLFFITVLFLCAFLLRLAVQSIQTHVIVIIEIQISHHLIHNKCIRQGTCNVDHGSRHVDDWVDG